MYSFRFWYLQLLASILVQHFVCQICVSKLKLMDQNVAGLSLLLVTVKTSSFVKQKALLSARPLKFTQDIVIHLFQFMHDSIVILVLIYRPCRFIAFLFLSLFMSKRHRIALRKKYTVMRHVKKCLNAEMYVIVYVCHRMQ